MQVNFSIKKRFCILHTTYTDFYLKPRWGLGRSAMDHEWLKTTVQELYIVLCLQKHYRNNCENNKLTKSKKTRNNKINVAQ